MNRDDLEAAYKRAGGRKGFLNWAATNTRQFFSTYGKDLLALGSLDPPKREPDPQAGEKFMAMVEQHLQGKRLQRELGIDAFGYPIPGVATVAGAAHGDIPKTPHGIENPTAPQPLLKEPKSDVALPDVVTSKPDHRRDNKPPQRVEPIPGLGAAAALGEGAHGQRSATELFYEWSGHTRPTWSPGRDWSGS
jgi:hypothetical protein